MGIGNRPSRWRQAAICALLWTCYLGIESRADSLQLSLAVDPSSPAKDLSSISGPPNASVFLIDVNLGGLANTAVTFFDVTVLVDSSLWAQPGPALATPILADPTAFSFSAPPSADGLSWEAEGTFNSNGQDITGDGTLFQFTLIAAGPGSTSLSIDPLNALLIFADGTFVTNSLGGATADLDSGTGANDSASAVPLPSTVFISIALAGFLALWRWTRFQKIVA